jgi:CubicO group peptidase (beta-lactamase class C family)
MGAWVNEVRTPGTDLIAGRYDEKFRQVADVFRNQVARTDGGAAVAVYHKGRLVVDLWGGVRSPAGDPWTRDTLPMCFSTTKGVTATCAHVLADRGELDYDEPVATYWPEFAQNGKAEITVRQVMSHSAGLHRFGTIIDRGSRILDWEHMTDALARAKPAYEPGTAVGYHALTFGWLVGELVRRISCTPIEKFLQKEIAEPLGLDGLYIGCPAEQRRRMAPLQPMPPGLTRWTGSLGRLALNQVSRGLRAVRSPVNPHRMLNTAVARGMEDVLVDPRLLDAAVPAMNGHFDAVSLAAMYAMLAGGGQLGGVRILSEKTVRKASEIQNNQQDRVVMMMTMQWRLGYHKLLLAHKQLPRAFGHFGFGGSGGFADPEHDLAMAMVCNRGHGTSVADVRIARLARAAARARLGLDDVD